MISALRQIIYCMSSSTIWTLCKLLASNGGVYSTIWFEWIRRLLQDGFSVRKFSEVGVEYDLVCIWRIKSMKPCNRLVWQIGQGAYKAEAPERICKSRPKSDNCAVKTYFKAPWTTIYILWHIHIYVYFHIFEKFFKFNFFNAYLFTWNYNAMTIISKSWNFRFNVEWTLTLRKEESSSYSTLI